MTLVLWPLPMVVTLDDVGSSMVNHQHDAELVAANANKGNGEIKCASANSPASCKLPMSPCDYCLYGRDPNRMLHRWSNTHIFQKCVMSWKTWLFSRIHAMLIFVYSRIHVILHFIFSRKRCFPRIYISVASKVKYRAYTSNHQSP